MAPGGWNWWLELDELVLSGSHRPPEVWGPPAGSGSI
jgi:hypothetical protein